jgi:hypothetical protein
VNYLLKILTTAQSLWLTPVILTTLEAEIRWEDGGSKPAPGKIVLLKKVHHNKRLVKWLKW